MDSWSAIALLAGLSREIFGFGGRSPTMINSYYSFLGREFSYYYSKMLDARNEGGSEEL